MLFFPEGTRSADCVMAGFKKGAFSVAVKAGVDVVPITIIGSGVCGADLGMWAAEAGSVTFIGSGWGGGMDIGSAEAGPWLQH